MITGGAGFIGSSILEYSIKNDLFNKIRVLDNLSTGHKYNIEEFLIYDRVEFMYGDISNLEDCRKAVKDINVITNQAALGSVPRSVNDPLSSHIANVNGFLNILISAKEEGIKRVVYASSSSVYGVKSESEVTEELPLEPLTDYSRYKAMCEDVLQNENEDGFCTVTVRPSTVCGYAPRLRLDLTVNILTNHAVNNRKITVFGGSQMRPNIHINDMVDVYLHLLDLPSKRIDGGVYNAGYENLPVMQIAEVVRDTLGTDIDIEVTPTDDDRSYHISSEKMKNELGFEAMYSVQDAVKQLKSAFDAGKIPDPMFGSMYYNIKRMQEIDLS